jgi:hypothetical protein
MVDTLCMGYIPKARLVGKGDLCQPVEDMHALTEATLSPLRCVVMRINESRDQKLSRGKASYGIRREAKRGERLGQLIEREVVPNSGDGAGGVHRDKGILEDLELGRAQRMNDSAVVNERTRHFPVSW